MANLKALKNRIKSVKSTQKITRAMKVVSASKLRRAREKAEAAAPYAVRMERMLKTLAANIPASGAPKLLAGNGRNQTHLLVVISSDRGLCGGFNVLLVKEVKRQIKALEAQGKAVKLFCVGKKSYELLKRGYASKIIGRFDGLSKQNNLRFHDAEERVIDLAARFESDEFDVCSVFYNRFLSAIAYQSVGQQIIPLDTSAVKIEAGKDAAAVYEYEPGEAAILEELLPRNLAVQFFHALLESSASEHSARMTAMDNATRNAGDMIKRLTLLYNRSRQAVITKELIEIISGAEAV